MGPLGVLPSYQSKGIGTLQNHVKGGVKANA